MDLLMMASLVGNSVNGHLREIDWNSNPYLKVMGGNLNYGLWAPIEQDFSPALSEPENTLMHCRNLLSLNMTLGTVQKKKS